MRSAAASAAPARHTAIPGRPLKVALRPRRVSGPAKRAVGRRPARRRAGGEAGIALGVLAALERLPRRVPLGGRAWIGLVAFALIGIVTLQLGLLKANAGIGRALEHEALLQRENAALSIENSELAASGRVTSQAARLGMAFVPTGALRFLRARPGADPALGATWLSASAHPGGTAGAASGSSETTSPGASAERSAAGSGATSASSEPASGESSSSGAAAARSSTEPAPPSSAAQSSERAPAEAARPSGESANRSAPASPSAAEPAAGSPSATPAGGTRAGSSG